MTWFRTGTLSISNASSVATITGATSAMTALVRAGDRIKCLTLDAEIVSFAVDSGGNASVTLATSYIGSQITAQPYEIQPTSGFQASLVAALNAWNAAVAGYVEGPMSGRWPDGTASAPAIAFADDQDTGFYRSGANEISVSIGGAQAARFGSGSPLTLLSGLTGAANLMPYWTGAGGMATTALTAAARSLLDDADVSTMRTTLGATATGSALFTAANPAVARAAMGVRITPNVPQRRHVTDAAWLISTSAANNDWHSVCWAPELGLFCAASYTGTGNRVMTSPDGITWTTRTSATDNSWRSIAWAPELGLFCAVANTGAGNRVMTSTDGITWTTRTSAADEGWISVCWSPDLGLFAAVANTGTGNRVMTSPNGITWTSRTTPVDANWFSVCWSPDLSLFAAVANSGTGNRVMTSPDGVTWTSRTSAADNNWRSIAWAPEIGLFCAVASTGTGNRVMTSPDGITWTSRTSADEGWRSVCWAPELGLFCAVADTGTGNRVMTSTDGITWTTRTSAADNNWLGVVWSPDLGLFAAVAISGTGDRAMTSVSAFTVTYRS